MPRSIHGADAVGSGRWLTRSSRNPSVIPGVSEILKVSTSNFSIPANLTASPNKIVILCYFYCFWIECYFFCVFLGATGPTLDAESYSKALFAHANVCAEDISAQTRLFIYGYQRRFYMVLDI